MSLSSQSWGYHLSLPEVLLPSLSCNLVLHHFQVDPIVADAFSRHIQVAIFCVFEIGCGLSRDSNLLAHVVGPGRAVVIALGSHLFGRCRNDGLLELLLHLRHCGRGPT